MRDIAEEAKEMCKNWMYKTACIREMLPRMCVRSMCLCDPAPLSSRSHTHPQLHRDVFVEVLPFHCGGGGVTGYHRSPLENDSRHRRPARRCVRAHVPLPHGLTGARVCARMYVCSLILYLTGHSRRSESCCGRVRHSRLLLLV